MPSIIAPPQIYRSISEIKDLDHSKPVLQEQCPVRGSFRFLVFSSMEHLIAWNPFTKHDPMFYEVIRSGQRQRFRLDLECTHTYCTQEEWESYVLEIIQIYFRIIGNSTISVARFESVDPANRKRSEHIVFLEGYIESNEEAQELCDLILERVGPGSAAIIDKSVYKTLQMFRVEGSSKLCDPRRPKRWKDGKSLGPEGLITHVVGGDVKIQIPNFTETNLGLKSRQMSPTSSTIKTVTHRKSFGSNSMRVFWAKAS